MYLTARNKAAKAADERQAMKNEMKEKENQAKKVYRLAIDKADKAVSRRWLTLAEAAEEIGLDRFSIGRLTAKKGN